MIGRGCIAASPNRETRPTRGGSQVFRCIHVEEKRSVGRSNGMPLGQAMSGTRSCKVLQRVGAVREESLGDSERPLRIDGDERLETVASAGHHAYLTLTQ